MNYNKITKLQRLHGAKEMQDMINSGLVWKMEGSMGREAMNMLEMGVCMLPTKRNIDYYGNTVGSRYDVVNGTKGSYLNCKRYWEENCE